MRISFRLITGVLFAAFITLVLLNVGASWGSKISKTQSMVALLRDPIVLAVIGAIITFLLVDRWRRLEGEISEIRQSQFAALQALREDAKNLFAENVEGATRKAQAIENRIGTLLADYPWIAEITESDFIPDASSCRVVLMTAEDLIAQGRVALAYEYLFSWLKKTIHEPGLEGSAEDFIDLAEFCERTLMDEYLGFMILREGTRRSIGSTQLLPDYLKRVVRFGRLEEAEPIAGQLRRIVSPSWRRRLWGMLRSRPLYKRSAFIARSMASLAVYEAL